MKPIVLSVIVTFLLSFFFGAKTLGQTFGANESAVRISDCNQDDFFNTSGTGTALIGPSTNVFTNANLGAHTQNSGTLVLRGGEVRTFKVVGVSNVCSARMYYRVYLQSTTPGSFSSIDLTLVDDCDVPNSQYPSGGSCVAGDQKWNTVIMDGSTAPYAPVNLTSFATGSYVLEVYYEISGSSASTTLCDETVVLNNTGNNYKALFSIQAPVVASNNPSTCNGIEGSVTIGGLVAGTTYAISYFDGGMAVTPTDYVANPLGQVVIGGLNAGTYSNFELQINGCITELNTGIILSDPLFTPSFNRIAPFCAGSTPPTLPTTSNNGITGSWNPSLIDNMNSGAYTFTPTPGQCGMPVTINITVTPKATPTFSFGTSLSICAGGVVPTLPNTSTNGINGTWSPSSVNNQNTATYTFTPAAGRCAAPTSFSVTVTPNVVPAFSFGTSLSVCAGTGVPTLPGTSNNNITGTWSPSTVDNQNSGTYTFTPTVGQCATTTVFNVTVNPNITPTFSFGSSLTICAGASVPTLPATSDDGITGTWNPSTINDEGSDVYTFTPTAGLCATTTTFTITVTPNIVPAFSFGTSLSICAGESVPSLPNTSNNGITGTWNASAVDNQNSGAYTFTPTTGQCATNTTFSVTVNPNITPSFSFGTSLSVCAGTAVPILPATSSNGITGAWSPVSVDNQNSGSYTFTPAPGVCANMITFSVTVNPNVTPAFAFGTSLSICAGGTVPSLANASTNGINGTWNPSTINNQNSAVYTFTPTAGLCATTTTFTVTVDPNIIPAFSFGTALNICAGENVPSLPITSTNNINGTWTPSVVDDQVSGSYAFTPSAGQCATAATFSVTVSPNITPTFSFGTSLSVCAGSGIPTLPASSSNGIVGTWNPSAVNNQNSGTYTFTPSAGQCATTTTFNVTVDPKVTPVFSFGTSLSICAGAGVPSLPATSDNGIAGSWNTSAINNESSGVYMFTPTTGLCATITTFTVTVAPNITPSFSFGTSLNICAGGGVPLLPNTSTNNINGTWSPSVVDNQNSGTYTFTTSAGQCATAATFSVTVNPNITPTFSFGTAQTICAGATAPTLPGISTNNITGTWSPSTVDNQNSGTYTFTPTAGQCATTTTFSVTVNPNVTPTFSFGSSLTICAGASVPTLPTTSANSITGTWNPSTINNQSSGVYTFTPTGGLCATTTTFTVTVNSIITPTFSFGTAQTICAGGIFPSLPNTSTNSISGTWNPVTINNLASGIYTFTPAAGQCAATATFNVTVTPIVTPTFSFGTAMTICSGNDVPVLPATSINNISGTWSPTTIDNKNSATYTFTPAAGQCGSTTTFVLNVTPIIIPVFDFGTELIICTGADVPPLPTTSTNGITGTWNASTVDNQTSAVYTFTPIASPAQCVANAIFTVTVKPILTPLFSFGETQTICTGSTVPVLPAISSNGITGTWEPAVVSNQVSGSYTFTSAVNECATPTATFTVTIAPLPTGTIRSDTTVFDGAMLPATNFSGTPAGVNYSWTNSNTAIGLGASGSGSISSFAAVNKGTTPITATITMTPALNNCAGTSRSYIITVKPLDKDVFVPNVFSPNGDGKNDLFMAYGNYIDKLNMNIFNQWGQKLTTIDKPNRGWDGTYSGKAQPVGVYVYELQAVLTDGRVVKLKGYITLVR